MCIYLNCLLRSCIKNITDILYSCTLNQMFKMQVHARVTQFASGISADAAWRLSADEELDSDLHWRLQMTNRVLTQQTCSAVVNPDSSYLYNSSCLHSIQICDNSVKCANWCKCSATFLRVWIWCMYNRKNKKNIIANCTMRLKRVKCSMHT